MDGSAELRQLAHLLRVGADAARKIATLRPHDRARIAALVDEAERMADDIDEIVGAPPPADEPA